VFIAAATRLKHKFRSTSFNEIQKSNALCRDNVQAVEVRMGGTPTWVRIGWKIYLGVIFALYAWLGIVAFQLGMAERSG